MTRTHLPAVFALACAFAANAQMSDRLSFVLTPELLLPLGDSASVYGLGGGARLSGELSLFGGFAPYVALAFNAVPTKGAETMNLSAATGGIAWRTFVGDRFGAGLRAGGGAFLSAYREASAWSWKAGGGPELSFRLSPSMSLRAGASYEYLAGSAGPFYTGVGAYVGATLDLSGFSTRAALSVDKFALDPVFPVFYAYYDKNAFGKLELVNGQDGTIRDVKVSFAVKQYMAEPKTCATFPAIPRGGRVEVPLYALFSEDVLKLTESTKASVEVIVDFTFLGQQKRATFSETARINHRNAMTWDDDRRAAAFVSAKDPAVLRYSKFAAGVIRDSGAPTGVDQNLRMAMGLFEGLKLYGVNYVVDPTTPYTELSASESAVDFLQYPYQTLVYKGGDCDDLSIMFAATLESVGIPSAFITVPGHIYAAFALSSTEAEAKRDFAFQDELVYANGKVWAPVEITLLGEGFVKAWQFGAREWKEAGDKAVLIPVGEAWKTYEPVGIPGEDTRILLPEAKDLKTAFLQRLDDYIARELKSGADAIKAKIAATGEARHVNALGVLYARYGKYDLAKAEFEKAARTGSVAALCNLGNVYFLERNYRLAADYYRRAFEAKSDNKAALLGYARANYELGDYAKAREASGALGKLDPSLAAQYAYVNSASAGAGRAAAAGENADKALWDQE